MQSISVCLADSFIDVDNVPSPKVPDPVDVGAAETFHEEIDCLISVDLHTTENARDNSLTAIPTNRFYSKTNRPKPRANVTIGLEELNAVKKKRRRKGPKLCMPTKRRRRHALIREFDEGPLDEVCAFIPPERHASVDSGVDMTDNVENDLYTYGDKYKADINRVMNYLPSRTLGKRSDGYVLAGQHVSLDATINLLPFHRSSASNYRCPCCP